MSCPKCGEDDWLDIGYCLVCRVCYFELSKGVD